MTLPVLAVLVSLALVVGYVLYGRFLARALGLDDARPTPAHAHRDGVDFEPTAPGYLLGQHFSAIAAAGPIVGPVLACQQFGWLPCVLWIALGCVLIGAVHDLSSLVASVRHGGGTIAEVVRQHLSRRAWAAFMAFIWLALVYVIVAFTDVTAGTFVGVIEELDGQRIEAFQQGGAVAFSSVTYLLLAVVMGFVQRHLQPPLWLLTVVFVPATLGLVWLGTRCSTWLVLGGDAPQRTWSVLILVYCFGASLLPVSVLMQPRGYLGGFILYIVLGVGVFGLLFGGHEIAQPAYKGWVALDAKTGLPSPTGLLAPFLFVTIACGACSGFHGLVCSGTTSKQIDREGHCRAVGYGGMLLEGLVALVALSTVMIVASPSGPPGAIYGRGIGRFVTDLPFFGPQHLLAATIFGTLAFSTFVFDTLDVATRLGRHCLQELAGRKSMAAAAVGTLATVAVPLAIVLVTPPGGKGYMAFWTLFGASNQLLAGLTLVAVSVWLRRTGRAWLFAAAPAAFVLTITSWALGTIVASGASAEATGMARINALVAALLLALAVLLLVEAARAVRRPMDPVSEPTSAPASVEPGPGLATA